MKSILRSRARYPMFFTGIFLIELGGLLLHFAKLSLLGTEIFAAVGFLVFLASFLIP
ncbi:MAG: hypothetical protein M1315_00425 [Candidatus Thermoplasmatota archaeon]|nr:hypothetical protein [Candidatus Thermoplasmatota archaeon]